MRALTIHQPWAALVAAGVKLIENRPVRPPAAQLGERFAIHAGLRCDVMVWPRVREIAPDVDLDRIFGPGHCGKILATARLVGAVREVAGALVTIADDGTGRTPAIANDPAQRRWFFGPVGYVLADVRQLAKPVAARGMQGWWPVPSDVEQAIADQERAR